MTEPACGLPGTLYFDLAPTAGSEPYRIFLFRPKGEPPAEGWPLLVLTDGNATFPFAFASLVTQAPFPSGTNVGWGVVAAIGYPSDEPYDAFRRAWDLGPPPIKSYPAYFEGGPAVRIGGTGNYSTSSRRNSCRISTEWYGLTRRGGRFSGILSVVFSPSTRFSNARACLPTGLRRALPSIGKAAKF